MSILDGVLKEEYERSKRIKLVLESELAKLPVGYISTKKIAGKPYFYLQKRFKSKIISTYIHAEQLEEVEKQVARRRQLEQSIKELRENIKKIERVIDLKLFNKAVADSKASYNIDEVKKELGLL
jgi:hypothetical protein